MSDIKISECFTLPVSCIYDEDGVPFQIVDPYNDLVIDGENTCEETNFDAVALAINNHDRLVEENQRLTAIATKHETRADELYEALDNLLETLGGEWTHSKRVHNQIDEAKKVLDKSQIEAEGELYGE